MGLKITSIARLPLATERDYFIYFLDYGWDEPLANAMYANFDRMAAFAAEHKSLVLMGLHRQEFANDVLSWHHVNGEDAKDLLPAIMISDCDPRKLGSSGEFQFFPGHGPAPRNVPERFLIIPLRKVCKTETDVAAILEKIAEDIRLARPLSDFEVRKVVNRSDAGLSDMIILQPNLSGVGVDLKKAFEVGSKYFRELTGSRDNTSSKGRRKK